MNNNVGSLRKSVGAGLASLSRKARFVLTLPRYVRSVRVYEGCPRSSLRLVRDLLTLFFSYGTYPDHYGLCRLWEMDRRDWAYYYGSNFHPPQSTRLAKEVHPRKYQVVMLDKSITSLLCPQLAIPIPFTYGVIDPKQNYRALIGEWARSAFPDAIIVKPLLGSMGRDIVLARSEGEEVVIQAGDRCLSLGDFSLKERSIVQKVLRQDSRMAEFSMSSVNTIRMLTMLTRSDEFLIVNASFRSGVGRAFVDNWSAGGVSVGVDCERGVLRKYAFDKKSRKYAAHPTSGTVFENHPVPEWGRICRMAEATQRAFSFYRMFGMDIALDESGEPVLIEANSGADIAGLEQKAGPLLRKESVLRSFGEYDLLYNKHQRKLYRDLMAAKSPSGSRTGIKGGAS